MKLFEIFETLVNKKIFNWFSNLSLNERIQICTIHNKWLSNLIKQLLISYEYDNNCCLFPLRDFQNFLAKKMIILKN